MKRWAVLLSAIAVTTAVIVAAAGVAAAAETAAAGEKWLCPMHPTYVSDRKGTCPICGMDLVPAAQFAGGGRTGIPGMAEVELSPEGIALAGVRTTPAVRGSLASQVRTTGLVTADETRLASVQTRVGGWIERLAVNAVGQNVAAGQTLLEIYSPELLAGQEELLRAAAAQKAALLAAPAGSPAAGADAAFLVEAARRRLLLFGVTAEFIDSVLADGRPSRTVPLPCPVGGVVTRREAFVGMRVEPGMELLQVADLSQVWVVADFYEYEAPWLAPGQPVTVELPFDPGVALPAAIDFVYPSVDPAARTQQARIVLANPFGLLRPGMYAAVTLELDRGQDLVIPDDAILDTGRRRIVFVSLSGGRFAPREVEVGARSGGRAQILSGLSEGDQVVIKANFLLDSESRIRASLAGPAGEAPAPAHDHPGGGQ